MDYRKQRLRLLVLMGALMVDTILGIALTTLVNYDPSKHTTVQDAVLGIHVLIAVGIIIGGIVQLISCYRAHVLRLPLGIGLVSTLVAFAAGGMSADSGNDVAVFIMATCFVIALGAYGYSLTNLNTQFAAIAKK